MESQTDTVDDFDVTSLMGEIRRIGETGPLYQVLGPGTSVLKGGSGLRIEFIESGEVIEYPRSICSKTLLKLDVRYSVRSRCRRHHAASPQKRQASLR